MKSPGRKSLEAVWGEAHRLNTMNGLTPIVALFFSSLALILAPHYAFVAYVAALLWYPSYLVMKLGTLDIPIARVVVAVLLMRCLLDSRIRSRFSWSRLDGWVAFSMAVYVGVFCISIPTRFTLENRAGFLMDTLCAYVVARFLISDYRSLVAVLKWMAIVFAPLAVLAVIESLTGWRAFAIVGANSPAFMHLSTYAPRWGLVRAIGPFSHSILLGCAFAMFLPLLYYLRHAGGNWRFWTNIFSALVVLGALSSLSMGSWIMVVVAIFCLAIEHRKRLVKPILGLFAFGCILVGIISNRPFYHVIASYANVLGGSGWHRAKLIDLAIEHFSEWCLLGYGDKDPGWGEMLGMGATDVTNEFLLAAVRYGLLGLIALCSVLVVAFLGMVRASRSTINPLLKSLYWAFGSILVSWMSVSFFGQVLTLFYCILGIIGTFCFKADGAMRVNVRRTVRHHAVPVMLSQNAVRR